MPYKDPEKEENIIGNIVENGGRKIKTKLEDVGRSIIILTEKKSPKEKENKE